MSDVLAEQHEILDHAKHHEIGAQNNISWDATYSFEYEKAFDTGALTRTNELDITPIYRINKDLKFAFTLPLKYDINSIGDIYTGLDDISISSTWRFYKQTDYHLAVIPTITLPTGNYQAGSGKGRTTYSANFIATRDIDPFSLHLSLVYKRNENLTNQRVNIWKIYFSPVLTVSEKAHFMANIGVERNTNPNSDQDPVYLSLGIINKASNTLTFSPTIKAGFNKPEVDLTVYLDFTW